MVIKETLIVYKISQKLSIEALLQHAMLSHAKSPYTYIPHL